MSGTIIPLFARTRYTFPLTASSTQGILIVKAIDVSQYMSGTLEVRLHDNDYQSGTHVYVKAYTTAPTPEEPEEIFIPDTPVATIDITTESPPRLMIDALDANFGATLLIGVEGKQASGGSSTFSAELSAYLTMKS